jgi:hypothetical protein
MFLLIYPIPCGLARKAPTLQSEIRHAPEAAKSNEDEIVYFLGYWSIDGLYRVNKLSFVARKPGSEPTNGSL